MFFHFRIESGNHSELIQTLLHVAMSVPSSSCSIRLRSALPPPAVLLPTLEPYAACPPPATSWSAVVCSVDRFSANGGDAEVLRILAGGTAKPEIKICSTRVENGREWGQIIRKLLDMDYWDLCDFFFYQRHYLGFSSKHVTNGW
jgi:hypothetical protein